MTEAETGQVVTVEQGLRRLLAPNPGPMTRWGTNTFIVGEGEVAVVDPGPEHAGHLDAILAATKGEKITHILVTHAHLDHSPLARRLARHSGAPVMGFGPPHAGRDEIMVSLAAKGLSGGGEGVDADFAPDITITQGDRVSGAAWTLEVLHTPGHFAGHLSFALSGAVISGDHVMDWSTSLVSPPDGDLRAFMRTSEMMRDAGYRRLYPAHGGAIDDPEDRLSWLIEHRLSRERAILDALDGTPRDLATIVGQVYTGIHATMQPAAARNVFAHLIDLHGRNLVKAHPRLAATAQFTLT
jgi:hydroxyacylglutathione hydrolase